MSNHQKDDHAGHDHSNPNTHAPSSAPAQIALSPLASATAGTASTAVFRIDNLDCATEETVLRKALSDLPEITALRFDLMRRELTVTHAFADNSTLIARIEGAGMTPVLLDQTQPKKAQMIDTPSITPMEKVAMVAAGVAAIGAEVVAYSTDKESSPVVIGLALLAIALSGKETLHKGWIALKHFTLNINLLMTVAVIGAVFIGQWPEAAMVIWLFAIAELIEKLSLDRARNAIRSLIALAPELAKVEVNGAFVEKSVAEIGIGQRIQVRPGERIAFDGKVESGASAVNQAPIIGESLPVEKTVGDTVFAGTINESGVLVFVVTHAKGASTLDRIAQSVQDAQANRAPTQRFVDNFARVYTPVMFVISLLVAIVPPLAWGAPWYPWIYKALVLLVIACPCALVISTPVTVVSGLAAAARRGILIKGGLYLEQGRLLKSIALDKTGTLTLGKPALTDVITLSDLSVEAVLKIWSRLTLACCIRRSGREFDRGV